MNSCTRQLTGILFTLSASAVLLSGNACADLLDTIRQRGHLVIAHREASFPFSFVDPDGTVRGYSMDLCVRLVDAIKKDLRLKELPTKLLQVTSATRLDTIASGKADLECGSTTNNAERRQRVDYTIPHFISSSRLLVKSGRGFNAIEDLRGKTIVSTRGTTNIMLLRRMNAERNLGLNIGEVPDHSAGFVAVSSGKADAFAMDDVLLFGLRANAPKPAEFDVIGKPMSIEPYAIMLPKHEDRFKNLIDREMQRIILGGEIYTIYRKWFESPVPPRGVNLELRLPYPLRDSFRFPTSRVNDWYLDPQ